MTAVSTFPKHSGGKNDKATNITNKTGDNSSNDENSAMATAKRIKALLKAKPHDESLDAARLDELRRIFSHQQEKNATSKKLKNTSVAKQKWNRWLKEQQDVLISQLQDRIQQHQRKSTLRTFCGVIASSPIFNDDDATPRINEQMIQKLLHALVHRSSYNNDDDMDMNWNDPMLSMLLEEDLLQMLDMEFMKPYYDFKYYMLVAIRELSKSIYKRVSSSKEDNDDEEQQQLSAISENILRILLRIQLNENDKLLLNNKNNDVIPKIGSNSHYLIPPPNKVFTQSSSTSSTEKNEDSVSSDEEEEVEDSDDGEDDSENDSESDDDKEEEKNTAGNNKRKANHTIGFGKKKKKKNDNDGGKLMKKPPHMLYSKHLRLLQEAWLELLKIPHLPPRALKLALQHLPVHVLPIVSAPLRFADFCIRAYDTDIGKTTATTTTNAINHGAAVTSILALHSLYYLMLNHGLEYDKFYSSLYELVTPHVFYAKHRTRFFKLLTNCLMKSQMLPGYLVAAFCKRLCRCALSAPPSGSLFVLALVSNLIRKHAECACLIHRSGAGNNNMLDDVYESETNDPESCRALESSLWELNALERHYHPAVAALAKSCGTEDEKTPLYDIDEFMLHTYKSLFEQERKKGEKNDSNNKKKKKQPPALTFQPPKSLFVKSNGQTDLFGSILSLPSSSSDSPTEKQ